jgi:anti-sigma-K factor RskA
MSDLKNILSNSNSIDEQLFQKYLAGTANAEERFFVENQMAEDTMVNEAIEGLQNLKDPQLAQTYVTELNSQLQKQIGKRKKRQFNKQIKEQSSTIIAIIVVLTISILTYFTIHLLHHPPH